MCVHVLSLPEDIIYLVFDRVPLAKLLRLDQVCKQWAQLLPGACIRRRTLGLTLNGLPKDVHNARDFFGTSNTATVYFIYFDRVHYNRSSVEQDASLVLPFLQPSSKYRDDDDYYWDDDADDGDDDDDDDGDKKTCGYFDILFNSSVDDRTAPYLTQVARLRHARLAGQLATYFAAQFPNLDTLLVVHTKCFEGELRPLLDLITLFKSLRTLKLWIRTWDMDSAYRTRAHPVATRLLPGINQLASLQQLTLLLSGQEWYQHTFPVELFSFVAKHRLVKLSLGSYDTGALAWNIVHRFTEPKWRLICPNTKAALELDTLSEAMNPQFEFANKVAHLYRMKLFFATARQFEQFCWKFGDTLKRLRMDWKCNITYTQLVNNLALLKRLHSLELAINFSEHPANLFELEDRDGEEDQVRVLSLPQVEKLNFAIVKQSHLDFESFSALAFPSVHTILVDNSLADTKRPCLVCLPNRAELQANIPYWDFRAQGEMVQKARHCRWLLADSLKVKFGGSFRTESFVSEDCISKRE